ncbi:MAG: hypothetical protein ACRDDZ_06320 [Marinifilaceae bacterium]
MELRIILTDEEIISFYRAHRIQVEYREVERYMGGQMVPVKVWQVKNPNTGKWMDMKSHFPGIFHHRMNALVLEQANHIDVLNSFSK